MVTRTESWAPADDELSFGIFTEQQWRTWDEILELWQATDESAWDSAWLFDHFLPEYDADTGPVLESWTLLAALAACTRRLQLGVIVTANTHRHPAILFKQAATVDQISNGRLVLGLGAGWNEREHAMYGLPLPPPAERVERFGEALELMHRLESEERANFAGVHYQLDDAPFAPKPVNGHIPVLVGTNGPRMLRHVARYADHWDSWGRPEVFAQHGERLKRYCREIDRDPAAIQWGITVGAKPLESEDALRAFVARYVPIGVRAFRFNLRPDEQPQPIATMQRAAAWLPALREEYRKDA